MNIKTPLKNKEFGIILLEGTPTIRGQIEARELALKHCRINKCNTNPVFIKSWITEHEATILKLKALINIK